LEKYRGRRQRNSLSCGKIRQRTLNQRKIDSSKDFRNPELFFYEDVILENMQMK